MFSFGFRPTLGRKPPMRVVRGRPDPVVDRIPANRADVRFKVSPKLDCLIKMLCGHLCSCRRFGA